MNDDRFDSLTQAVAVAVSRRDALRLLAGGIAGGMFGLSPTVAGPALAQEEIADLAEAMRAWEFSAQNVEAAIAALAQAGIPVFEGPADTTPILEVAGTPSPLRLLRAQVHNLSLELSARNGIRGKALDALFPPQEGIPPPSFLLAGYVATAQTPGGELARALMGKRNWTRAPELILPQVVFLLFASDLARDAGAQPERRMAPPILRPADLAANGVCSTVQQFIDGTIAALFDALKIETPDNLPGQIAAGIWNWLVDIGEGAVKTALGTLTAPVIQTVRTIAGALAIGGMVVSLVQNWTVRVDPTPARTRFGIGSEIVQGEFVARVDTGLLREWPPHVVDCAATAGVQMPPLNAGGSPTRWTRSEYPIDLIQDPPLPEKLDADGTSTVDYVTNNESEAFARGEEQQGTLTLEARVKRQDLEKLQNALVDLLLAQVPAPFNQVVASLLGPQIKQLTNQLVKLTSGYGFAAVAVIYHDAPCIVGSWEIDNDAFLSALRADGGSAEASYDSVSGQAIITFGIDGTASMVAGGFTVDGTVTSSACSADVQVFMNGTWNTSYTDDGSSLAFDPGSGDLTYTTSVNACGVTSSTPISAAELYASIPISYTCEGDTFQYTIPPYFTAPVVLRRIRASDQPPLEGGVEAPEEPEDDTEGGAATRTPGTIDAIDDKATTAEETPVDVEVLANDCGEGIEISDVSTPIHGTTTVNPEDNTITYTPADRFTGTDGFTYEITDDAGETDTATVTVEPA